MFHRIIKNNSELHKVCVFCNRDIVTNVEDLVTKFQNTVIYDDDDKYTMDKRQYGDLCTHLENCNDYSLSTSKVVIELGDNNQFQNKPRKIIKHFVYDNNSKGSRIRGYENEIGRASCRERV